jgi:hypothetical protein
MGQVRTLTWASGLVLVAVACNAGDELGRPVRLECGGRPIDVDTGHAAPFVCDFDGDGLRDLLVGQFDKGKLRIHRNVGTSSDPRYDGFAYFQAGGEDATVPAS